MGTRTLPEFVAVFSISLLICMLIRWDALTLLPFWDEVGLYWPYAYSLFKNGFGFDNRWVHFALVHPPLYFGLIAATAQVLGWKLGVIKVFGFISAALFASGAYYLVRLKADRWTAIAVAFALTLTPITLTEMGMAQPDLPMAALFAWCVYFLLSKKPFLSSLLFACAVLVNATALVVGVPGFLYLWLSQGAGFSTRLKAVVAYFSPCVLSFGLWAIWFHSIEGNWISGIPDPDHLDSPILRDWMISVKRLVLHRPVQVLLWDGRWIITSLLILLGFKRKPFSKEEFLLLGILGVNIAFLSAFGTMHQRYTLVALPSLFVLSGWWMAESSKPTWARAALCVAGVYGAFCWFMLPYDKYSPFHYRSHYRDYVALVKRSADRIEQLSGIEKVRTHWPVSDSLRMPFLGYLNPPLDVSFMTLNANDNEYRDRKTVWVAVSQKEPREDEHRFGPLLSRQGKLNPLFKCEVHEQGIWLSQVCYHL